MFEYARDSSGSANAVTWFRIILGLWINPTRPRHRSGSCPHLVAPKTWQTSRGLYEEAQIEQIVTSRNLTGNLRTSGSPSHLSSKQVDSVSVIP